MSISILVDRQVSEGNKEAFEKLLEEIIDASRKFPGYEETEVIKPKSDEDHSYRVLFRFDTQEHLDNWVNSNERLELVEKIDKLLTHPTRLQALTGLETWFTLPGHKTITPPPRYKMAIVSWIAITPLLMAFNYLFGEHFTKLPFVLRFALSTPWIVLIMTYFWMPLMTKIFRFWLYPKI
jgi:antibiotic biosynthesis monooxygenase (ABM) superfamily enzyme